MALTNLLADEDHYISTMAMEKLLSMKEEVQSVIAEYQESHDPAIRNRIHQLGSILKIRQSRSELVQNIKNSSISLWEGTLQINYHYDPKMEIGQVNHSMSSLSSHLPRKLLTAGLANFMRNENFSYAGEDIVGPDLFLIEDVLLHRVGAPILFCVIAKELARKRKLDIDIVLFRGQFCLLDKAKLLIDPTSGWKLIRLNSSQDYCLYQNFNIWLAILSQLFTSTMLEGRLQAIHRVAVLLSEICGNNIRNLPFPLGS